MRFSEYFFKEDNSFPPHNIAQQRFPIKNKKWNEIGLTLMAWNGMGEAYKDRFHLTSGVYGAKYMTSLDAAYSFTMSDNAKAVRLFNYILDSVKTQDYSKLNAYGIAQLLDKIIKPIIKHFQQETDIVVDDDSGLSDRVNNLNIPDNVKDDVLEQLSDIEEFLPKDLILKTDEELIPIIIKLYQVLKSNLDWTAFLNSLNDLDD